MRLLCVTVGWQHGVINLHLENLTLMNEATQATLKQQMSRILSYHFNFNNILHHNLGLS